jgi:hypothetical protein
MYKIELRDFILSHDNWEELLIAEPYSIKIKREAGFVIFNYNQLSSDFNNEIVRECRGIIFKEGEWEYPVCHAFDKFGNYGESYVPEMDWTSIKVSEKIDGSIMKLWCYDDKWYVSTNGNIDAEDADVPDIRKDNFRELFFDGVVKNLTKVRYPGGLFRWLRDLKTNYTYIFEMVSPYTRVVIPYEYTDVYFLGARNNESNYQYGCDENSAYAMNMQMFPRPKIYSMNSLEDIIDAANELPWDAEGYVCYDKYFNRCKIKSPRYVVAHFARNNNVITRKHLIDIILKGEMNEFLIYASDYKDQMEWTKQLMEDFINVMNTAGTLARNLRKLDRPRAAEVIKFFHKVVQSVMFMNLDRDVNGEDYVKGWDAHRWERVLEQYIKFKEKDVNDL